MDPARPRARSVAVAGGRIIAVDLDPADLPAREVVDLHGAALLPGFHDAHNHMASFGLSLAEVDLSSAAVRSLDELYAAVAGRARQAPLGGWVVGTGYDQNKLEGHPNRDGLDRAAAGRRVWLRHTSGHMCVVSSAVLADLGLADQAIDVPGGAVITDASGRPTGLLQEKAQGLVGQLVHPYPVSVVAEAIDRAGARYLAEGLTSVTEAGVGGGWVGHTPVELAAYQLARDTGRLHVRVELMIASDALHTLTAHQDDGLDLGLDLGIRTGFGDDWLRIGAMKIFTDGSLVGLTAAMHEDFAGQAGNRGFFQADADELTATIVAAHRSGWQIAAHAIGDRAIDLALDAYAQAQRRYPRAGARHRIEHFGVVQPGQVARAAELGVIPVPQGRFASELGDGMLRAVGPDRQAWLYRQRSLLDAGLALPGKLRPASGRRGAAARHPRHGEPTDGVRCAVQPRRGDHRARGTACLHQRLGLRQPRGAPEGFHRHGQASRPGRLVAGPDRCQPRGNRRHRRPGHLRRRRASIRGGQLTGRKVSDPGHSLQG